MVFLFRRFVDVKKRIVACIQQLIMYKYLLVLFVFLAACAEPAAVDEPLKQSVVANRSQPAKNLPTLTQLFDSARSVKELEFHCWIPEPFLYFKSGRFIEPDVTTAVVAKELNDSTIEIQLWSLHMDIWTLLSQTEVFGPGIAFSMNCADYNFDGQTDIYHNVSCSNGYALRRGNLIIVSPETLEMTRHPEAAELANIWPDERNRRIRSAICIACKNTMKDTCELTSKWMHDSLVTTDTVCPCDVH